MLLIWTPQQISLNNIGKLDFLAFHAFIIVIEICHAKNLVFNGNNFGEIQKVNKRGVQITNTKYKVINFYILGKILASKLLVFSVNSYYSKTNPLSH